jgi:hypothetical protein
VKRLVPMAAALTLALVGPAGAAESTVAAPKAVSTLKAAAQLKPKPAAPPPSTRPVVVGLVLIVLVAAASVLLGERLSRRHQMSLNLVIVVIGFGMLLMLLLPVGGHPGWLGTVLFFGLAGVYRLLGRFEAAGTEPVRPQPAPSSRDRA